MTNGELWISLCCAGVPAATVLSLHVAASIYTGSHLTAFYQKLVQDPKK
jgi:hypothetical protein